MDRLKSRKFWITVFTAGILALNGQYNQAVVVVAAYLGIQGVLDGQK